MMNPKTGLYPILSHQPQQDPMDMNAAQAPSPTPRAVGAPATLPPAGNQEQPVLSGMPTGQRTDPSAFQYMHDPIKMITIANQSNKATSPFAKPQGGQSSGPDIGQAAGLFKLLAGGG